MSQKILYSADKFMMFPEHLQVLREGGLPAPLHVRIKPMNHCNHACWYCAYRSDGLQLGEDMDLQDQIPAAKMFEIVQDLIAMQVKAVTFSGGGEPLLYKPLPEVVERLAAAGIRIGALTNGSNLKGRVADVFARWATWVRVSTNVWDDASFASLRGGEAGGFTRLLRNMQAFSARGSRCVLGLSFIVDAHYYRHLARVAEMFRDAGVHHIKFSGVVIGNSAAENNAYHEPLREEVAAQLAQARELQTNGFSILDHYHELGSHFAKSYQTCPFLSFLTVIGADCKVYTCQDKAYTQAGTLGSIATRSFKEFWFSAENRHAMAALDPARQCQHHCVTHQKNLNVLNWLQMDAEHAAFV